MGKKLLLVFIHGFRGSDTSFKDFPQWLETSLSQTLVGIQVETVVYPKYKTSGDLSIAVRNFSTWLIDQAGNDEPVDIVLLGHSMGGIVGAETILLFNKEDDGLKKISIIGLLAYDTPFYSVNEGFISRTASSLIQNIDRFLPSTSTTALATSSIGYKRVSTNQLRLTDSSTTTTSSSSSSGSSFWNLFAMGSAIGMAAFGAYLTRDRIVSTVTSAYDHLEFISALVDPEECHQRMIALLDVSNIFVRCFYVKVRSSGLSNTFIALPPPETNHVFTPMITAAESEIDAHISIFDPRKNDQYYTVGSDSIALIYDMVRLHE